MTLIPVILSGGAGTRLWPLSAGNHPKQFLSLISEKTMIQETLLRLDGLNASNPIVVCGESHRFIVAEQMAQIGAKASIILEPFAKNTAPAIAAACQCAVEKDPDAVVIILASDHVIKNADAFKQAVLVAAEEAMNDSLVTFGIVPTEPNTGYGYVKTTAASGVKVFNLEKFVEKPCLEKAKEYLADGNYSWNSGMFVFKASAFLEELSVYDKDMCDYSVQSYLKANIDTDFIRLDPSSYEKIKGNSIDYAVMEHTTKGKVVKLDAGWNDVGSWSALWEIKDKDENQNVLHGDVIALDTKASYIRAGNRTVATIGLENIVIVDAEDALLIAAKDKVQDVKKVAEELKKRS